MQKNNNTKENQKRFCIKNPTVYNCYKYSTLRMTSALELTPHYVKNLQDRVNQTRIVAENIIIGSQGRSTKENFQQSKSFLHKNFIVRNSMIVIIVIIILKWQVLIEKRTFRVI